MAKREKSEEIQPLKKPPEPINWPGEPERKCGNCEHWRPSRTQKLMGDCRNGISNMLFTRESSNCSRGWYPDVERFPLHERLRRAEGARP